MLFESTPAGIEIAGTPAIFIDTVQISAKYISSGLFDFDPIVKAVVGETGVNKTSYFLKASLNLLTTYVRTFCAFL